VSDAAGRARPPRTFLVQSGRFNPDGRI